MAAELTANKIATTLHELMDGQPVGSGYNLPWVSMNTGIRESLIEAFIILGPGRGANWRLGFIDGRRVLIRTQSSE